MSRNDTIISMGFNPLNKKSPKNAATFKGRVINKLNNSIAKYNIMKNLAQGSYSSALETEEL